MATFKNSPAASANKTSTAGGKTVGGEGHMDVANLMDRCIASNSATKPTTVNLPKEKN